MGKVLNTKTLGKDIYYDSGELTISGGAITVTGCHHTIDTESDASTDDRNQEAAWPPKGG